MKLSVAIDASHECVAYRYKDNGQLMMCDGKGMQFWTQTKNETLIRWGGGASVRRNEEWIPLPSDGELFTTWVNKTGPIREPEWQFLLRSCESGVVARHFGDESRLEIRNAAGVTWREFLGTAEMVKFSGNFVHNSGWHPLPPEAPVLKWYDPQKETFPYRHELNAPSAIKGFPLEIAEWVETGTSPILKKRAEHAAAQLSTTEVVRQSTARRVVLKKAKPAKRQEDYQVDLFGPNHRPVESGLIDSVGPMAAALASGIKDMIQIGDAELAKDLATQLKWLTKNAAWLLREDRGKWEKTS